MSSIEPATWPGAVTDGASAVAFLEEAARYFENRTMMPAAINWADEDRVYWANTYNAENCRRIAKMIALHNPLSRDPC